METSTEIETKILNSFEQMIQNLTSEKDLDDQVNISNIQSAVDNIINEINGDPRNGFKKSNLLLEKGEKAENRTMEETPANETLSTIPLLETVLFKQELPIENALLPNNTLLYELFPGALLPNRTFPGTLKLNSHGKLDVICVARFHGPLAPTVAHCPLIPAVTLECLLNVLKLNP